MPGKHWKYVNHAALANLDIMRVEMKEAARFRKSEYDKIYAKKRRKNA